MKVVFIVASYATVYLMYIKFKATYDHNHDTFRIEFLLIPCVILSLLITRDYSPLEVSIHPLVNYKHLTTYQIIVLVFRKTLIILFLSRIKYWNLY